MTAARREFVGSLEPRVLFAAGAFDPTFGQNGELAVQFPGQQISTVRDSTVQADGKVVIVGESPDPGGAAGATDFAVARINPDGTPDLSFAQDGVAVLPSPGTSDGAFGVTLQPDGKIIVVGGQSDIDPVSGNPLYGHFTVARFNPDGTLDDTFGTGGIAQPNLSDDQSSTPLDEARKAVVLPDGRILAVGLAEVSRGGSGTSKIGLARFNPDGSLDHTFGSGDGFETGAIFGTGIEGAFGVALQPDGKFITVGTATVPDGSGGINSSFITLRYNPDGSIDSTFGDNGGVSTTFTPDPLALLTIDIGESVDVQSDGKIVVGGTLFGFNLGTDPNNPVNPTLDAALARYNPDGTPDTSFGTNGQVDSRFDHYVSINKIQVLGNGKILASGLSAKTVDDVDNKNFGAVVAQYQTDGTLDPTFGTQGTVFVEPLSILDIPSGLHVQTSDMIANAAMSEAGLRLVAAAVTPAAASDQSSQFQSISKQQAAIAALLKDGSILVVGTNSGQVQAARLIGDGPDLAAAAPQAVKVKSARGVAKGSMLVSFANQGNAAISAPVTIRLFLSTGQTVDGSARDVYDAPDTIDLDPGGGRSGKLKFAFSYPTDLPDGTYNLLVEVDAAGTGEVNAANNVAATGFAQPLIKPFVKLSGAFVTPPPLRLDKKAKLSIQLHNDGNSPAKGVVNATVFASPNATRDGDDVALQVLKLPSVNLKPNATKTVKILTALSALAPGTYYLLAVLDGSAIGDADLSNTVFSTTPVQVA